MGGLSSVFFRREVAILYKHHLTSHANTMLAHVNIATPLKLNIQAPIVDVLIGDMFFHPDDQGETTQKNMLKLFKHVDCRIDGDYEVVLLNPDQFKLVV